VDGRSTGAAGLVLLVTVAMLVLLLPARPAYACSCAEMTLESIAERDPDAAVARIRRIDDGGGRDGVGQVIEVVRGPDLPDEVPLALDDGASCLPGVAVGDVAVLAFEPVRGGWRTMECGMLDPATGLDDVTVDPAAAGLAALVLSGSIPGADLVVLDDHLRVLAVATAPLYVHRMLPCGDDLLALGSDGEGRGIVVRMRLPDLEPVAEYLAFADPEAGGEHLGATCEGERVDVLLRVWGAEASAVQLHRDVFGAVEVTPLPDAASATFAGDLVVFVQPAGWGDGPMTVSTLDPASGHRRRVLQHPAGGWELTASPDGRHVLVRGSSPDGPMLLSVDLEEGRVVGETQGWWQPVQRPWVTGERILQLDEQGGEVSGMPPDHRIVDLTLTERQRLDGHRPRPLAAFGDGLVTRTPDRVTIADADAVAVRHLDVDWAAGVWDAVVVGPVEPDPQAAEIEEATPIGAEDGGGTSGTDRQDGAVAGASSEAAGWRAWTFGVVVLLVAATTVLVKRRGRTSPGR
jgi:hypothetical protein